ncbi:aromatic amino acid transport family protein [Yersinia enterocolitica]
MINSTGINSLGRKSSLAQKSGLTDEQWKESTKFDSTDWGWVILSIGMAIGAGIVFLPVKVGLVGLWVFLLSAIIGYPVMYMFQKLFINTLVSSPKCEDYPSVISGYLGKNWGIFLGFLYFIMIVMAVFMYSTALINDSASFLHSFGATRTLLSANPLYGLIVICAVVAIASQGEKFLFKISTGMVLTKISVVGILGFVMIPHWDIKNIGELPNLTYLLKETVAMLPFTMTSILFIQTLSPMVISYRSRNKSIEVAWFKSLRAMNIAFWVLFITVFFYAISFTLAMGHDRAVIAANENISALAMAGQGMSGNTLKILSLILNIFAVMTAFFGVYLGFKESCRGIAMNILQRFIPENKINKELVAKSIIIFAIALSWSAVALNFPILKMLSYYGPITGLIGCLIPAYLVYKVPFLHKFKGISLILIISTGVLLLLSPLL